MTTPTFTVDDVIAELALRGTAPHWIANAAGVDRRVLEAALDGDPASMSLEDFSRVGRVLGLGQRVVATPVTAQASSRERVLEAARTLVADDDRTRVHDADAPWVQHARRAGVDVAGAFGVRP